MLAYRVASRVLVNGGDAENVAAETLARAQYRWTAVSDHAEPWVVTVATRLAVREAKRSRRPTIGSGPAPDRADDVVVRVDLGRASQRLSRRKRQAVALRYLTDFSDRDGASAMGCSVRLSVPIAAEDWPLSRPNSKRR